MNNLSERTLRQVVVGRGNWQFFGSPGDRTLNALATKINAPRSESVITGHTPGAFFETCILEAVAELTIWPGKESRQRCRTNIWCSTVPVHRC